MSDKNKKEELQVSCEAANLANPNPNPNVLILWLPVDEHGEMVYDLDTTRLMFENFKAELKSKGKEDIAVFGIPMNIEAMFLTREGGIQYLKDIIKELEEGKADEQEVAESYDEENS